MEFLAFIPAAILAAGLAWYFWVAFAIFFIAMSISVSMRKLGAASLVLIAGTVALFIAADVGFGDAFQWVKANAGTILLYILGYLAIGVIWSSIKWVNFLFKVKSALVDWRAANILPSKEVEVENDKEDGSVTLVMDSDVTTRPLTDDQRKKFYQDHYGLVKDSKLPPAVRTYKDHITLWMMYWPFSMIVFFLEDALTELYNRLYDAVSGFYQNLSNRIFKGIA